MVVVGVVVFSDFAVFVVAFVAGAVGTLHISEVFSVAVVVGGVVDGFGSTTVVVCGGSLPSLAGFAVVWLFMVPVWKLPDVITSFSVPSGEVVQRFSSVNTVVTAADGGVASHGCSGSVLLIAPRFLPTAVNTPTASTKQAAAEPNPIIMRLLASFLLLSSLCRSLSAFSMMSSLSLLNAPLIFSDFLSIIFPFVSRKTILYKYFFTFKMLFQTFAGAVKHTCDL